MLKTIRSIATARKMPTPTETVRIRTMLGTPETCSARICRSGSEIVTRIPMIKLKKVMSQILLVFASHDPIFEPSGCMDISAPMVKIASPAIRHSTPSKKRKKVLGLMGASVIPSNNTIAAMGMIEISDS